VEKLSAPPRTSAPAEGMRRAIAAAMARSKREIPHYYVSLQIDMFRLDDWLKGENEKRTVADRLLPAVPLLKATALALEKFPELNGYFVDGGFRPSKAIHVGFAVATRDGGLVTPAIHDVARKTLTELMVALSDLITRTRKGGLRSSELSDGTFTVTSLGERGVDSVQGIIYPPQVGLLGLGRIAERAWIVDGLIGVRPILTATLAADHRVSDGHRGALFLRAFEELLMHPEQL
jgi:pyruvate dehydrogenase E2 component (dihydrolipoamide acetyltransferase)